jgi:hypothetical protein
MKNAIAKIVQHTKNGQIAYMRATIICVKAFNDFQAYARILTLIALCSSAWFTAGTTQAQEAPGRGLEFAPTEVPGRLFAQDTAESAPTARPHRDAANVNTIICVENGDTVCAQGIWSQIVRLAPDYAPAGKNLSILNRSFALAKRNRLNASAENGDSSFAVDELPESARSSGIWSK